jgi:transposase-like protein
MLKTVALTAEALNIDHSLVRYHLKKAGEPMNSRGGRRLSDDDRKRTLAAFAKHDHNVAATADALGISEGAARGRFRQCGVKFDRRAIPQSAEAAVAAAFHANDTYEQIADRYGASVSAVKRLLHHLGEEPRFRRPDLSEKFRQQREAA